MLQIGAFPLQYRAAAMLLRAAQFFAVGCLASGLGHSLTIHLVSSQGHCVDIGVPRCSFAPRVQPGTLRAVTVLGICAEQWQTRFAVLLEY